MHRNQPFHEVNVKSWYYLLIVLIKIVAKVVKVMKSRKPYVYYQVSVKLLNKIFYPEASSYHGLPRILGNELPFPKIVEQRSVGHTDQKLQAFGLTRV